MLKYVHGNRRLESFLTRMRGFFSEDIPLGERDYVVGYTTYAWVLAKDRQFFSMGPSLLLVALDQIQNYP